MASESIDLDSFLIPDLPSSGYYIPNFITVEEEQQILGAIYKLPSTRWTTLTHRRLLSLPSQLSGAARDTLIAAALPSFLERPVLTRLHSYDLFCKSPHSAPNHVLVNEYNPGEGIMPHEDGPAYYPITATVSLAGHTVLDIYRKNDVGEREAEPTWRILQEPRSLLITTGDMYRDTLHGIAAVETDQNLGERDIANWHMVNDQALYDKGSARRQKRVSLTYRDVWKVAKVGGALKFMNKR